MAEPLDRLSESAAGGLTARLLGSLSACGGSPARGAFDAVADSRGRFSLQVGLSAGQRAGSLKAATSREFAAETPHPYFTVTSQPPNEVPTTGDDHLRGNLYSSASA